MNPYVRLLQAALSEAGISCSVAGGLSPRSLCLEKGTANILHLHWLELLYSSLALPRTVRRLTAVLAALVWAKSRGCKIVYTLHNLNPHEQAFPFVSRAADRMVLALADAVHVHDDEAKLSARRVYGQPRRIYVVPHGSYIGAYPNDCTRQEARARLGLADNAFVYLFLGQVRRYKGVEDLIAAFTQLPDGVCRLCLAGHVHDQAYGESLIQLVRGQERIHTWFHYVADSEVQHFMNACDVCVLPYRDVTTSGAAILAFSFGKPIIAPVLGGFTELAANGRGIAYDPERADGLLHALQQACLTDMVGAGQKAWMWAKEHEWQALAPSFISIYEDVLGIRSSCPSSGAFAPQGNGGRGPNREVTKNDRRA